MDPDILAIRANMAILGEYANMVYTRAWANMAILVILATLVTLW